MISENKKSKSEKDITSDYTCKENNETLNDFANKTLSEITQIYIAKLNERHETIIKQMENVIVGIL